MICPNAPTEGDVYCDASLLLGTNVPCSSIGVTRAIVEVDVVAYILFCAVLFCDPEESVPEVSLPAPSFVYTLPDEDNGLADVLAVVLAVAVFVTDESAFVIGVICVIERLLGLVLSTAWTLTW